VNVLSPDARRERAHVAAICVAAALSWVAFRYYTGIVLEDALITWRYAEHLAEGAGLTFNAGERVLGTTTPVLAVALAVGALVAGSAALPMAAVALMVICGVGAGWYVYRSLRIRGFSHAVSLIATGTLMLHADMVWSTVGGMETPLVLLLMAMSLFALLSERYYLAAVSCAVMPFVRPDAAIWVLMVVVHALWYGKRRVIRPAMVGVVLSLVGAAALTMYFGSPLPHSVTAKRAVGTGAGAELSWYGMKLWFNWIVGACAVNPFGGRIERIAIVAWLGLVALGAGLLLRRSSTRPLWPLVAFPPALAIAFLMSGAPHFLWYLVPFTACLLILGGIGIGHLCVARWPSAAVPARAAILAVVVLMIASFAHTMRSTTDWHWKNQRNEWQVRQAVGDWLRTNTSADSSVLMEAIGYQGTLSGRRVIDLAGLVTPRVVELQRQSPSNAASFARILSEFAPDYIALRTAEIDRNLHFHGGALFETDEAAAAFRATYHPAVTFTAPYPEIWSLGSSVTVYSRH
jgi:hypothetical protein